MRVFKERYLCYVTIRYLCKDGRICFGWMVVLIGLIGSDGVFGEYS